MPASLNELVQSFRPKALQLLEDCRNHRMPMVPYFTIRHPREQARLWRQSRSRLEVETGIAWLREVGAPWLADVLESVGPCFGRWATNAVPGNSWHQWGLALDCYAEVDGRCSWDTVPGQVGGPGDAYYRFYAQRAEDFGLRSLGASLGDWPHVQDQQASAPARVFTWPEIDTQMERRFSP